MLTLLVRALFNHIQIISFSYMIPSVEKVHSYEIEQDLSTVMVNHV